MKRLIVLQLLSSIGVGILSRVVLLFQAVDDVADQCPLNIKIYIGHVGLEIMCSLEPQKHRDKLMSPVLLLAVLKTNILIAISAKVARKVKRETKQQQQNGKQQFDRGDEAGHS